MNLIQRLAKGVEQHFERDAFKAGVVVSKLNSYEWYVSIARYPGDGSIKKIEASAKGSTLDEAALGCALDWLVKRKRTKSLRDSCEGLIQAVAGEL